jgi:thymidylate synthase (FAD)
MKKTKVLDHGYVRLVDSMGSDLSIVRAARVSYDAAWRAGEDTGSDARLINYLWSHKHTTPFEAVTFTFEVHAPIFVFRQWHRHRTWSFNELSARYRELPEEFYVPDAAVLKAQSKNNKQGRDEDLSPLIVGLAQAGMRQQAESAFHAYRTMLEAGVARELARSVLPVSTYSTMFATVNLLNLFKFMSLRSDPHAQYEIRVYSDAIIDLIQPVVPVAVGAWKRSQAQSD